MKDPADHFTPDLLRERLESVQAVIDRSMRLSIEARRVQRHFRTASKADENLGVIAMAISDAHVELQIAIADWLTKRSVQL